MPAPAAAPPPPPSPLAAACMRFSYPPCNPPSWDL
jgi:hypothetical protein